MVYHLRHNKMKYTICHIVRKVQNINMKIVKRGITDTPKTQSYDHSRSLLRTATPCGGAKLVL